MINVKIISRILGTLLFLESIFLLLALPVSLLYEESDWRYILLAVLITAMTGALGILASRGAKKNITRREGYIIVTLAWVLFSVFGSLPFVLSGAIPSFTNAFFETMSGFTTTGASILTDVESLPHGLLFWRSMTQWLGGMGIIVLSLAILPLLKIGNYQLFTAEVPSPAPDKLQPKIKETAKRLWALYIAFTLTEMVLLMLGGMDAFDAICHSFTTMATGGYSTKQDSIAHFGSPYIQWVFIIFMFLAGTNFTLSYLALKGKVKKILFNDEFRFYLFLIFGFSLTVGLVLFSGGENSFSKSIREATFQVVSIITTTGYTTVDYTQWIPFLSMIVFILMFTGGSAGSTGGGIKTIRILLLFKNSRYELKRLIHPNAVIPIRYNQKSVPQPLLYNVLAFVVFYFLITGISAFIISGMGYDLSTSFGSVAATLGNIGPGIGGVGPSETYLHFPVFGKWFLSFLMLLGRLELFTVLILFSPSLYKR